jgi:hypothetical protein
MLTSEQAELILDKYAPRTRMELSLPGVVDAMAQAIRDAAAEATAAYRERVRAQAIHFEGAWWECRLCGSAWSDEEEDDAMPQEERHNKVNAQPCAAEVEP